MPLSRRKGCMRRWLTMYGNQRLRRRTKIDGRQIEDLAACWWSARGARIIARNFRFKGGEIDLIIEEATSEGAIELVFVEVRARAATGWVTGVESVTTGKWRRLSRTALLFLTSYEGEASAVRFDILAWDGREWLHIENARGEM